MEVRVSVTPALHTNIVCKGSGVAWSFVVNLVMSLINKKVPESRSCAGVKDFVP